MLALRGKNIAVSGAQLLCGKEIFVFSRQNSHVVNFSPSQLSIETEKV